MWMSFGFLKFNDSSLIYTSENKWSNLAELLIHATPTLGTIFSHAPIHIFPRPHSQNSPPNVTHLWVKKPNPPHRRIPFILLKWRLKVALIELRNNVTTFQGHWIAAISF